MKKCLIGVFLALLFCSVLDDEVFAQGATFPKGSKENPLVVSVAIFPPMVMKNQKGEFYGYDVDLWNEVTKELGLSFIFQEVKFQDIFSELEAGKADIAISGITITDERERRVDFSHHYFDSGLRIMVRESKDTNMLSALQQIWDNPQNRRIIQMFAAFLVLSGFLFWLLERKNDQTELDFLPGLLDGTYWSTVTSATLGYGDKVPKSKIGKTLTIVVIFIGIAFFNYFQAQLSSIFVLQKFESSISNKRNLVGKTVATEADTTSAEILKRIGANVEEFKNIKEIFKQLEDHKVDAVVLDAPILSYYINNEGGGKAMLVGDIFDKQYYGIAMRQGSELRESINCALLKLRKNGFIGGINHRWLESVNN